MSTLNERKRRALELLTLGGLTRKQAGKVVGVSGKSIGDWIRKDPEFKRQLEAWRAGPAPDARTVAQSRRIILDELGRRVLHDRETLSMRELLAVYDRLTKEGATDTEEDHDDDGEHGSSGFELTPEQAERIWAMLEQDRRSAEEDTPDRQGAS